MRFAMALASCSEIVSSSLPANVLCQHRQPVPDQLVVVLVVARANVVAAPKQRGTDVAQLKERKNGWHTQTPDSLGW